MNIRNINQSIESLVWLSNEVESDEARESIYAQIAELSEEKEIKLDSLANLRLELEAKIEQQQELMKLRKDAIATTERAIEWLLRGIPLDTVEHSFKFRKSTAVVVNSPELLPESYRRIVPESWNPDKVAIGKSLKAGEKVAGCILEERLNLQIK